MNHRREQIQQIVETVLFERSGLAGAIETGYDLGGKDLFNADEALAHELYTTQYRINNASAYGLPPEAVRALQSHADRIKSAIANPSGRRVGRALGMGVGAGKALGKGFAIGIPMGIASSLASNLSSKLTNNYAYVGSGTEGREPSVPDLPEFGLELNR